MGNMIGILSTVILVSTLATLIFAVGAYVIARRRRELSVEPDADEFTEEAPEPRAPLTPITPEKPEHVRDEREPEDAPPRREPTPAPRTAPPVAEPGADGPLFRKLTLPGESAKAKGTKDVERQAERDQPNWE